MVGVVASVVAQAELDLGTTISGELETGESDPYTFEAEAGTTINISLTSDDFDPYLTLTGTDGGEIATDDDSGGDRNALIVNLTLPETGTYTVVAASFNDQGEGTYKLALTQVVVESIAYGETITEDPAQGVPVTEYTFSGAATDQILVTLTTQETSGFVEMTGPDDERLGSSLYLDSTTTRLGPVQLPEAGAYSLTVRASSVFALTLQRIDPATVSLGESVVGSFDADDDTLIYSFTSEADQLVDFNVQDSTIETRLDVMNPGLVAESQTGTPPVIQNFFARQGQTYYVILTPSEADATGGSLTLSIAQAPQASLDDGPVELNLTANSAQRYLTFAGSADEVVRLSATASQPMTLNDQPYIAVTQAGATIATLTPQGTLRVVMDFRVPEDGEVRVLVQTFTDITYTVSLTRNIEDE
jgi:hypothetical protein